MFEFIAEEFLSRVLVLKDNVPATPVITTSVVLDGNDENETAIAACNFLVNVFDFLNANNGTSYDYREYYSINPETGSGEDTIVMIESGIMDSPYLQNYILANCIHDRQMAGGG